MPLRELQREIVLIEDSANDAELIMGALQEAKIGHRLCWLKDGAEALDYFHGPEGSAQTDTDWPAMILLDLKLPKVNGVEVLRRLKADPRTQPLPVVVLTSSAEERDIAATYALGANSYIVKPVDFDQFRDAVQQLGRYWLLLNQLPLASPERR